MEWSNIQPQGSGYYGYRENGGEPIVLTVEERGGKQEVLHYVAYFPKSASEVEVNSLTGDFCGPFVFPS